MNKYQDYARKNWKLGTPIDELWHPEIIEECMNM